MTGTLRLSYKYMVSNIQQLKVKYFEDNIPVSLKELEKKMDPGQRFFPP